ncbi:hypothetical protein ACTA71_001125 [Dictyostelium dimigraforme]
MFGPSYNSNKLKVQLKLAVSRIQILKNKKANIVRDEKRNVADLLRNKNEESARIRVETIVRDEYLIECFQIIEVLCELLHARINLINATTEMPLEMKESIFTLVYSSQRVQIPELEQIKNQLKAKYGKGLENEANCHCSTHVNPKIVHKLSYATPDPSIIFQTLSEIAEKFNVDWCGADYPLPPPQLIMQQPIIVQQPLPPQVLQQSPQIIHHQQPQIIQPPPQIIHQQQQSQMPSFPIMSPPQQPTFSQIQHQQQIQQQYQQQHHQQQQQQQSPQFPSAPPSFYSNSSNNNSGNQTPQFPTIPTNNINGYGNDNFNSNNNNNNNNNNIPPPYQPPSDTGYPDYDELTARFEALKRSNDF